MTNLWKDAEKQHAVFASCRVDVHIRKSTVKTGNLVIATLNFLILTPSH